MDKERIKIVGLAGVKQGRKLRRTFSKQGAVKKVSKEYEG